MSQNELNATAWDLLEVRSMIAQLKAEEETLVDQLKAVMVESGKETLTGDGWKATWKNVLNNRFDTKAFRTEHPDLASQYMKQTVTTRFVIKA